GVGRADVAGGTGVENELPEQRLGAAVEQANIAEKSLAFRGAVGFGAFLADVLAIFRRADRVRGLAGIVWVGGGRCGAGPPVGRSSAGVRSAGSLWRGGLRRGGGRVWLSANRGGALLLQHVGEFVGDQALARFGGRFVSARGEDDFGAYRIGERAKFGGGACGSGVQVDADRGQIGAKAGFEPIAQSGIEGLAGCCEGLGDRCGSLGPSEIASGGF